MMLDDSHVMWWRLACQLHSALKVTALVEHMTKVPWKFDQTLSPTCWWCSAPVNWCGSETLASRLLNMGQGVLSHTHTSHGHGLSSTHWTLLWSSCNNCTSHKPVWTLATLVAMLCAAIVYSSIDRSSPLKNVLKCAARADLELSNWGGGWGVGMVLTTMPTIKKGKINKWTTYPLHIIWQ